MHVLYTQCDWTLLCSIIIYLKISDLYLLKEQLCLVLILSRTIVYVLHHSKPYWVDWKHAVSSVPSLVTFGCHLHHLQHCGDVENLQTQCPLLPLSDWSFWSVHWKLSFFKIFRICVNVNGFISTILGMSLKLISFILSLCSWLILFLFLLCHKFGFIN